LVPNQARYQATLRPGRPKIITLPFGRLDCKYILYFSCCPPAPASHVHGQIGLS
jgi:hypothetical protein